MSTNPTKEHDMTSPAPLVPGESVTIARRYHPQSGLLTHALALTPRPGLGPSLATTTLHASVRGIDYVTAEVDLSVEQTLAVAANLVRALGDDFAPLVDTLVEYHSAVVEGQL